MSAEFKLPDHLAEEILASLTFLYDIDTARTAFKQMKDRLAYFHEQNPNLLTDTSKSRFSEADSILITYGDQVQAPGRPSLQVLAETLTRQLKGVINSVHILPFYPYSSDDGFSVIDYTAVNLTMGDWDDLVPLRENFRLMFDAVINHISVQNEWFQGFLQDDENYTDYFIVEDPSADLSGVTRPRTHPLLTPVETPSGVKHVWTTFSADQIDLNYKNPAVLLEVMDVLLFYISQGAELIRLDAIGYLWKEVGTPCIHLPQTHRVIQLFRTVLNAVAPHVILITETNVPHAENISYFGDGYNEAQMVYNFSLPPLILHTLHTGNAEAMQTWAASLTTPSDQTTFFNFIASHDGIGVMPAKSILSDDEIQALVDKTLAHGGLVSYKTNPDGSQSVYELNITLFDALSDPKGDEPEAMQVNRFMVSQAIMLALAGVPGIYAHSLAGSHNNLIGVQETGRARMINREKWLRSELEAALANPNTIAAQVFQRYRQLLIARSAHTAFHPNGNQQIFASNPAIFAILRTSPEEDKRILCLHNVSAQTQEFKVAMTTGPTFTKGRDILSGQEMIVDDQTIALSLAPYEVKWLLITSTR
jgi:sucrose phosphorylase